MVCHGSSSLSGSSFTIPELTPLLQRSGDENFDSDMSPVALPSSSSHGTFAHSSSPHSHQLPSSTSNMNNLPGKQPTTVTDGGANETVTNITTANDGRHTNPTSIRNFVSTIHPEHGLSFLDACKLYPSAIGWSAFVSLGVIMLAFDPQLLGNLYAMPRFKHDFGYLFNGEYIISAPWQTSLSMGNPAGQVIGALAAGYPMEAHGRKRTYGACVVLTAVLVSIQFCARSLAVLLAGELLSGLVLGSYAVIAPAYSSEVCPLALRGVVASYVNLCFVVGQLLANCVCKTTSGWDDHWAYSIPFALQWVWCAVILAGWCWVPESPWWLVRRGRLEEAEGVLRRLARNGKKGGCDGRVDVGQTLAVIVETDRLERELEMGSRYWDCFKGVNLRRTEISVGVYCTQVLSGIYLINYGTNFFNLAGLPTDQAFNMGIGFLAVGFLGTVASWPLIVRCGRRTIYNSGLLVLVILQLLIGILDCIPGRPNSVAWAQASLMLVWNFFYDISIGPVCFVIISEASATRVRSKSIAVATAAQGALGCAMTVAIPYMINPDEANIQGKLGFFFGGLAGLCLIWAYFRIPETKGRTFEELDILFENKVATRRFRDYIVDYGAVSGEYHDE